jgi:hypothetical protein
MKKYIQIILIIITVTLITGACNDPVFYTVSREVQPRDPVISGGPANILVFDKYKALYTASGINIYTYTVTSGWKRADSQPGGMITHLAASRSYLYALGESGIKRSSTGNGGWEQLGTADKSDYKFQSMYGAGGVILIGAENEDNFKVYYIDENETNKEAAIKILLDKSGELCGAAGSGGWCYFITKKIGAYRTANPALGVDPIAGSNNIEFSGIINLEDASGTIISIAREGSLYTLGNSVSASVEKKTGSFESDYKSTGALAIWRNSSNPYPVLLLAGRQNSLNSSSATSYNYGYLEIELNSGGIAGSTFREPGTYPSTVDDNDRFKSTIGKEPVNYLIQTPKEIDPEMTLFASTQKNGLWSYKVRDNIPQWNAEEVK